MARVAIPVEVCLSGGDVTAVSQAVTAAREGDASRIELCRDLHCGGLTPPTAHVTAAREAWGAGHGLLVMLRPRDGDFCYTSDEVQAIVREISHLADAGAGGVVFGALRPDGRVDAETTRRLVEAARKRGLSTTFHRAFDAAPNTGEALEALIALGLDRVLTCGIPWGRPGTVLDDLPILRQTLTQAAGRIETVLGGGITPVYLPRLLPALPADGGPLSIHAHSGAQTDGVTTTEAVRALVGAAWRFC